MIGPQLPSDVDEDGNEVYLPNCPIKYVPSSIISFLGQYDYQQKFPSAPMPSFSDVSPKFWEACVYFEKWYNIVSGEK